jgi:hypothetical protein
MRVSDVSNKLPASLNCLASCFETSSTTHHISEHLFNVG